MQLTVKNFPDLRLYRVLQLKKVCMAKQNNMLNVVITIYNLPRYDLEGGISQLLLAFLKIPSYCDVEETDWFAIVQYWCLNTSLSRCHFPQYKWEM
jgi:hypothetical protein